MTVCAATGCLAEALSRTGKGLAFESVRTEDASKRVSTEPKQSVLLHGAMDRGVLMEWR